MKTDSSHQIVRNYKILSGAYATLLLASFFTPFRWLEVQGRGKEGIVTFLCILGLVASLVAVSKPLNPPYRAESLIIFSGILIALIFASGGLYFSSDTMSLSSLAFLVLIVVTYQVVGIMWSIPRFPMRKVDDRLFAITLGGVIATLASLLVLPWYKLSFSRTSTNFSFFDWKDLYDEFGSDVSSIRILYFETGYVASIVAAIALTCIVYRGRTNPLKANAPVRWALIVTTALMGLWSLVLVLGMKDADSDGGLQYGAWFCVLGHVAMTYAAWKATLPEGSTQTTPSIAPFKSKATQSVQDLIRKVRND